jgi:hypothetical protein
VKLASRWALRHGFTLEQARRFVAWVDGWVAFHRNERSAMRGIDGMDIPAYYNKLEASALERAQSAFLKLAAVDDNPRALRGLSAREAWQFLWWLERETRRYREQAFQNVERDETTEYRGVEAATLAKAHDAFVAIARGTMEDA